MSPHPRIAVCIATHNRRAELQRTLEKLQNFEPAPAETLVLADGCTDDTEEFVRKEFPGVRLLVHQIPQGSVASRNALAAATHCEVVLSLDDDSYPIERDFFARLSALFAAHERLGVASFPQRTDEHPATLSVHSFGAPQFVGSFANSAAALRRSVFLELGQYPAWFFHAYEEPDFAVRCVAAGWEVRYETSLTVRHHYTQSQRNEGRVHRRHARNEVWSVLLRCQAPHCFAVAVFRAFRQFGYAWRRGPGWVLREPVWWVSCLRGIPRCVQERRPLPWASYLRWMRLVRQPEPIPFTEHSPAGEQGGDPAAATLGKDRPASDVERK